MLPLTSSGFTSSRFKEARKWSVATGGLALLAIVGCSHQPIVPDAKNVDVRRENPSSRCREIGRVEGSVVTNRGTIEQAIEDMKLDAARKGANYVRMETTGAMGTSVSGMAYNCP